MTRWLSRSFKLFFFFSASPFSYSVFIVLFRVGSSRGTKQQLSTLAEGDAEPAEEPGAHEQNRISSKGNPSLLSSGGTEILLGDQSLRQESR